MHPQGAPSVVGEVLGNYRVIGELSRGGMGTVYRAEHELLGRPAAIKLLRPELSTNDDLVARFFQEAKAATAVRHPGIVEVYDFGHTEDGRAYLVMELLEGESLADRLSRRGQLTEGEAARIVRGIASALKAAHGVGIIHRDLKPDNVFIVADADADGGERVKVLDFGVAKLTDFSADGPRRTQTGVLMGTPLYMAPEQARAAGDIDHRADLYSLGCILYELVVGRPPFVAEGAGEIVAMHLMDEAIAPTARGAALSPSMEATIMRLLEKEPDARFDSAHALHAALGAIAASSPRVPIPTERVGSSAPRTLVPTPVPGAAMSLRVSPIDRSVTVAPRGGRGVFVVLAIVVAAAVAAVLALGNRGEPAPARPVPREVITPTTTPAVVPPTPTPSIPTPTPLPPTIEVIENGATRPPPRPPVGDKPTPRAGSGKTRYTPKGSPIEVDLGDGPRKPTATP